MEKRLLLAFVLSAVIFALWSILFPPQKPPVSVPTPPVEVPETTVEVEPPKPNPGEHEPADLPPPARDATVAQAEETVRITNDVQTVEFTNRGAAITSFELLGYQGDGGEPLDLIQAVPLRDRSLPLQLVNVGDGESPDRQAYTADRRLYVVEQVDRRVTFRWGDGQGSWVEKVVEMPESGYGLDVDIETRGELEGALVSVGTGLRNPGEAERNSRLARWGDAALLVDGELQVTRRAKLKKQEVIPAHVLSYGGFQDTYFLLLFRPATRLGEIHLNPLEYPTTGDNGKVEQVAVIEMLMGPLAPQCEGELLGAPKEYKLLQQIGGGVEQTLNFGFFGPISVLFLKALWWIYGAVGNYGVAIIMLTVAIRLLLFPLMHTSTVSMRKMQKLQPKIKEIQAKYKKKKQDQQARAKMNQEMMALYKQEGVNPMGGCLPLLVQLPILWALYKLFLNAIELRHAPFILWIQDLSAKDPYYVTPILMTATMWLQQRLAPQAGDPQQQKMMRMLPLVFGIMFLQFPSGLVLYWLTNNVLTIIQQEVTLHLVGERKRRPGKGSKV